jgi:uncharacterized damage-inducible protein DinB
MKIFPPLFDELSSYYQSYAKFLHEDDLLDAIKNQSGLTRQFFSELTGEKENLKYAENKWMIKEVLGHLSDTERILSYRALRFSRNDQAPLPSFDENSYMENSNFRDRMLENILIEWQSVRNSTLTLFLSMNDEMLDRKGTANNITVSPRMILYFILVHERHHINIVAERYLNMVAF